MPPVDQIAANLDRVHAGISAACERSSRRPEDVQLVAVTKYAQLDWLRALISLGHTVLGESRPQQLAARASELAESRGPQIEWHMIGHLQRNKVDVVLPVASLIHSVDSLRLARRISAVAASRGMSAPVLIEVNVSGEQSKDGFAPDDLQSVWDEILELPGLSVRGLMTMAPRVEQPELARPYFAELRTLRDELGERCNSRATLSELSMGMSGDYEVAIEEGATLIRVGSSLFEGLS
ncbi:MAG: YggS family pyridoxal phosphate-dependent enzyme [Planctomycetota bacterium]|jgi:pyridoxal phosphate enzyme (YggS family)